METTMKKIIETVPNFSEGRNAAKIRKILDCFTGVKGVKLLDHHKDKDHNRLGDCRGRAGAGEEGRARRREGCREDHRSSQAQGEHPRMGAVDVIPFVPIGETSMEEAIALSLMSRRRSGGVFAVPVFLYEESASRPERRALPDIRREN